MFKIKNSFGGLITLICLQVSVALGALNPQSYNVRDYGAVGDGKALDHTAINKAIEAASAVGGGTVLVPAGTYLCGSIRLKSNINLHIDAGAVVLGAPLELKAYDETENFTPPAYQDGGHTYFHNSLIWGEHLTNVSITGRGIIHGGGMKDWNPILDKMAGCSSEGESKLALDLNGKPLANNGLPPVRIGNKAIALKLCNNILIRDVTIAHGGHFAILATGCDLMTIDNVTIDTNRDGIDIDCCRNVVVSNCRVNAPKDDAICPKTSYALGEIRFTENLTIVNCQVSGFEEGTLLDGTMKDGPKNWGVGRIKFGTETSGGFRNVTVANCTFRSCMGLAIQMVDGGIAENIAISNITMTDVKKYGIFITSGKRNRTPDLKTPSRMRNIYLSNIIMDGVDKGAGIVITGLPEKSIEGIRLDNILLISKGGGTAKDAKKSIPEAANGYPKPDWAGVLPSYGIFARHIKGLELDNIRMEFISPDLRPAACFEHIDGLELNSIKGQVGEGVSVAEFAADVQSITVTNSPRINVPAR